MRCYLQFHLALFIFILCMADSNTPLLYQNRAKPTSTLTLLGASGSVGSTTIDYLERNSSIKLEAISVHRSTGILSRLIRKHSIEKVCITDTTAATGSLLDLKREFPQVEFFSGPTGLIQMVEAAQKSDTVLTAVVGAAGINATLKAIDLGKKIALANKETLVTAGPVIASRLENSESSLIPVDSEHNAIFQVYTGRDHIPDSISQVILTASGGPFRDWSVSEIQNATREQVLNHPTWSMGPKITVDSAGMINKGLELIEAHFLFGVPYRSIQAVIHRDSYVHGMIRTSDGGYLIAVSRPDMVYPVAHALCYPAAVPVAHDPVVEPADWPSLSFEKIDPAKYPGFGLCTQAGKTGGTAPAILNAANEVAVSLFLQNRIRFTDIPDLLEWTLNSINIETGTELGIFVEADQKARALLHERYGDSLQ